MNQEKYPKKLLEKLPNRLLTNIDVFNYIKGNNNNIKHVGGVFISDNLPKKKPWKMNAALKIATLWKNGNIIIYFNSNGNLKPPLKIIKYLDKNLLYNYVLININCIKICAYEQKY